MSATPLIPGLAIGFVAYLIILTRFNQWPDKELYRYSGAPRDYISDTKFYFYSLIYFATFLGFAFALAQLGNLEYLLNNFVSDGAREFLAFLGENLGENSFFVSLAIVLILLLVPQVARADQRWRGVLLDLARIPREALELKQQMLESLQLTNVPTARLDKVKQNLEQLGHQNFWAQIMDGSASKPLLRTGQALVKALYLSSVNKMFRPQKLDLQDLAKIDARLREIAAVLPAQAALESPELAHDYRREIDLQIDVLTEMLAKNCVKQHSRGKRRYQELIDAGFRLEYVERSDGDIKKPALLFLVGLLAICFSTVILFLTLFDLTKVSRPPEAPGNWLELERVVSWSWAGWVSYAVATGFGLFFNEVTLNRFGHHKLLAYILAVPFAILGSFIFFVLSDVAFRPTFVWLAISFGLVAIVAIQSRNRDYDQHDEVIHQALRLMVGYGVASGLLQLATHLSSRPFQDLQALLDYAAPASVVFLFGAVRGGAVAFLLAYVFLEYERVRHLGSRRRSPRISLRRSLAGRIGDDVHNVQVKNLSEQGVLLRLSSSTLAREGDEVRLRFDFADLRGKIVWSKRQLAGVALDLDAAQRRQMRAYLARAQGYSAASVA